MDIDNRVLIVLELFDSHLQLSHYIFVIIHMELVFQAYLCLIVFALECFFLRMPI
jgi:hypothetical protein